MAYYKESILSEEKRKDLEGKIKYFFKKEYDMDLGVLRTNIVIDFIEEEIVSLYYNAGVIDSMKYMEDRIDDMYILMKD